jgi:signal transduction histidine kinase
VPLRIKIMLWYSALLILLLGVVAPFIYLLEKQSLYMNEESIVKEQVAQIMSNIDIENGSLKIDNLDLGTGAGTCYVLMNENGETLYSNGPPAMSSGIGIDTGRVRSYTLEREHWLVYDQAITEEDNIVGVLRAGTSLKASDDMLNGLLLAFAIAAPVYLLVTIAGGLFIAGRALSPIDKMTKVAREIGRSNLSKRLNLKNRGDEVGRLAETFDEMLSRLEQAFMKEKQFTSDASHELRTPLAVMYAYVESMLSGDKSMAELRESAETIQLEVNRMKRVVSQLLILTRGDDKKYEPEYERFNLGTVIRNIILERQEIGEREDITIRCEAIDDVDVTADQTLMMQMLINLIDNALKFNRPDGTVTIQAQKTVNGYVRIIVDDTGEGIPQEDIPHIFDRFFRGSKSRNSAGAGLGLSIVKWIVDLHKGTVSAHSGPAGTRFSVEIPDGEGHNHRVRGKVNEESSRRLGID